MRRRIVGKGVGPRAKRSTPRRRDAPRFDTEEWTQANMLLAARARGRCELGGEPLSIRDAQRHHRKRRRDGGDRLANLLLICEEHHRWITDQPESVTQARERGWIVPALGIAQPDTYAVLLWGDTWVFLDDDGKAVACDAPR